VGPQVEKLYGGERFVILYVLTGVAGVLGSYYYHPHSISAGASGAIFGLFGVLLVFGVRYRNSIPPAFKKAVGTGVLPVIAINLIIGFTIPQIDNAAHISGLLAGAALAGIVPFQRPAEEHATGFRGFQVALLVIIAASFYQVAVNYDGPGLSARNLTGGLTGMMGARSSLQEFIDAVTDAQNAFEDSTRQIAAGQLDGLAETRTRLAKSIDRLRRAPSPAAEAGPWTAQLALLLQDQHDLIQDVERSRTVTLAHSLRLKANNAKYEELAEAFSSWIETERRKNKGR
jgi:hypothetical protein